MKRALPCLGPLLVLLILLVRLEGPSPKPANAPANEFSAARAFAVEKSILAGIASHPIGSLANEIVRSRIAAYLKSIGYEVRLERAFGCDPHAQCGWAENIIATAPGTPSAPALALMAHHDSVPAGPGASDDGLGVATMLEVARTVRTESFRNPILFLFTDGEEGGLLGAEAFAADPNAPAVAAVINVDNRGTHGASLLYETNRQNLGVANHVLHALPRPATNSLNATIYDLMPHDTDLTVFKRAGKLGVNFAAIGDIWAYHTPLDNLQRVSPATLQHHGDNVLASLRALGNADLMERSNQNAVWFDVLMMFVVSWREHFTLLIAVIAFIAAIAGAALLVREDEATLRGVLHGTLAFLGVIIIAALAGFALATLGTIRSRVAWVAHPLPIVAAMWLTGIAAAIGIPSTLRRYTTPSGLLAGQAIIWSVLAIALARILPGASYLAVVPAAVLAVAALVRAFTEVDHAWTALAASALVAIVLFAPALAFYDGLGNAALPAIAIVVALAIASLSFAFDSRGFAIGAFAAAIVCTLIAVALPYATPERPRSLRITHVTDGGRSRWVVGDATPAMRKITSWSRFTWPWAFGPSLEAPASPSNVSPLDLTVVSDQHAGNRDLVLRLHSNRQSQRVTLFFRTKGSLLSVRINGFAPPPRPPHYYEVVAGNWHRVAVYGSSEATVEIVTRGGPISLAATDMTYGIPEGGRALAQARDASDAVTSDDGDVTLTMVRREL